MIEERLIADSAAATGESLPPAPAAELPRPLPLIGNMRIKLKLCKFCLKEKPHGEFDLKQLKNANKAFLRSICKDCRREQRRLETAQKNKKIEDKIVGKIFALSLKDKIDAPHISELAAVLTKELGGLQQACARLSKHIQDTAAKDPKAGARLYFGWIQLVKWSSEQRATAPDLVDLSNEDLEREARRLQHKMAADQGQGASGAN